jgi:hypothetical protein
MFVCKEFNKLSTLKVFDEMCSINTIARPIDGFAQGYDDNNSDGDHVETF